MTMRGLESVNQLDVLLLGLLGGGSLRFVLVVALLLGLALLFEDISA